MKVEPRRAGLEVLSIRRTRKEEVLLVLKKGGDISASSEELDQAVGERAEISALVSTRSLEITDLDVTVKKEEGVSVLCLELGTGLGKVRIGWVECEMRHHGTLGQEL